MFIPKFHGEINPIVSNVCGVVLSSIPRPTVITLFKALNELLRKLLTL